MAPSDKIRIERAYRDAWGATRYVPDETIQKLETALRQSNERHPNPIEPRQEENLRCFEPDWMTRGDRLWGIAVQLYGVRTPRNWGIGDFTDLKQLIVVAAREGADFVGVNPLHALYAADPMRFSPYSPSSREFINTLYIDPEAMRSFAVAPEAQQKSEDPAFQAQLVALKSAALIDYPTVFWAKEAIFRESFIAFTTLCAKEPDNPLVLSFANFVRNGGEPLRRFAAFQALSCQPNFGASWMNWPTEFHDPAGPATQAFIADHPLHIAYHEFLQWEADAQLADCTATARDAGMRIGLYLDIAIGTGPESAEGWSERVNIIPGFHVGAPPDAWNQAGQDWGLAVYDPYALMHSHYQLFRRMLRAMMRHAAALRIDHVLGFYRLFLVPADAKPADGIYLHLPAALICNALAAESAAHRCLIIGEDLGTVPEDFPALLAAHNILSCRLLIFAKDGDRFFRPDEYPAHALVSIATHDLPPFLGFWYGTDIEARAAIGLYPDDHERQRLHDERIAERQQMIDAFHAAGFSPDDNLTSIVAAAHGFLARTPCRLAIVQMEDLAGERQQPNLPGSGDEHPNWQRRLSRNLDDIFADANATAILDAVRAERPRHHP
jgi:4-alpha-glucanotransferase